MRDLGTRFFKREKLWTLALLKKSRDFWENNCKKENEIFRFLLKNLNIVFLSFNEHVKNSVRWQNIYSIFRRLRVIK